MADYPILYILMRTDLASMNPGKAVAHGAHAANHFQTHWSYNHVVKEWLREGDGFGTTVTLAVNEEKLRQVLSTCFKFPSGRVDDPSYPIRDGEVTHQIPLTTCGYVFGFKEALSPYLENLELMK